MNRLANICFALFALSAACKAVATLGSMSIAGWSFSALGIFALVFATFGALKGFVDGILSFDGVEPSELAGTYGVIGLLAGPAALLLIGGLWSVRSLLS